MNNNYFEKLSDVDGFKPETQSKISATGILWMYDKSGADNFSSEVWHACQRAYERGWRVVEVRISDKDADLHQFNGVTLGKIVHAYDEQSVDKPVHVLVKMDSSVIKGHMFVVCLVDEHNHFDTIPEGLRSLLVDHRG